MGCACSLTERTLAWRAQSPGFVIQHQVNRVCTSVMLSLGRQEEKRVKVIFIYIANCRLVCMFKTLSMMVMMVAVVVIMMMIQ